MEIFRLVLQRNSAWKRLVLWRRKQFLLLKVEKLLDRFPRNRRRKCPGGTERTVFRSSFPTFPESLTVTEKSRQTWSPGWEPVAADSWDPGSYREAGSSSPDGPTWRSSCSSEPREGSSSLREKSDRRRFRSVFQEEFWDGVPPDPEPFSRPCFGSSETNTENFRQIWYLMQERKGVK